MGIKYTIELTEAQAKALETQVLDITEFLTAYAKGMADNLVIQIGQAELSRRMAAGEAWANSSMSALVTSADVKSAKEVTKEADKAAAEAAKAGDTTAPESAGIVATPVADEQAPTTGGVLPTVAGPTPAMPVNPIK